MPRHLIALLPLLLPCFLTPALAAEHPQAEISNGEITAKFYLPDAENGYYRGTRFDWSGVIHSLTYKGHEYFGEWQQSDDPTLHDRITGPVEHFRNSEGSVGFSEAKPGEVFLCIGIGACEKPDDKKHHAFRKYKVVDPGKWTVRKGKNWIQFTQVLDTGNGYAYTYHKWVTLTPGTPELVIRHTLENTGEKAIETSVYNHNFFVIDDQPTGPDFVVEFPFELTATRDLKGVAEVAGKQLRYLRNVPEGTSVFTQLEGYGNTADDNRFVITNKKVKAGVRARGDKPLSSLVYWSPSTTLCPEPYIDLNIKPGEQDSWAIHYEFFTLD